jgi:hypothetical protein
VLGPPCDYEVAFQSRADLSCARFGFPTFERLDVAIQALAASLDTTERNEHEIQICITSHPVLFGVEYREVIPKHRFGDDYEMDYALRRLNGTVDLVELESSTLKLFTESGQPRSDLVHAEQQVQDWQNWMQNNGAYAARKLS